MTLPYSPSLDEHTTPPYCDEPDGQKEVLKNRHFPAMTVSETTSIFEGPTSVHSALYNKRGEEKAWAEILQHKNKILTLKFHTELNVNLPIRGGRSYFVTKLLAHHKCIIVIKPVRAYRDPPHVVYLNRPPPIATITVQPQVTSPSTWLMDICVCVRGRRGWFNCVGKFSSFKQTKRISSPHSQCVDTVSTYVTSVRIIAMVTTGNAELVETFKLTWIVCARCFWPTHHQHSPRISSLWIGGIYDGAFKKRTLGSMTTHTKIVYHKWSRQVWKWNSVCKKGKLVRPSTY